jgi:SAM-dependent methyltransferase
MESDLVRIEAEMREAGLDVCDYFADTAEFSRYRSRMPFPADYHGGSGSSVYLEKLLEHFVAWDMIGLDGDARRWPYVDIAAASSPWAAMLRQQGLEAYSLDLAPDPSFAHLDYYLRADATEMPFADSSIGSASLQCAYEMFQATADTRLLLELGRVMVPGGRAVILPLYMHTHACYYQSPEHVDRCYGDDGAVRYVRPTVWNVPCSRKYSVATLRSRVLEPAACAGLQPLIHVLRNKSAFGENVYLNFILTLDKAK